MFKWERIIQRCGTRFHSAAFTMWKCHYLWWTLLSNHFQSHPLMSFLKNIPFLHNADAVSDTVNKYKLVFWLLFHIDLFLVRINSCYWCGAQVTNKQTNLHSPITIGKTAVLQVTKYTSKNKRSFLHIYIHTYIYTHTYTHMNIKVVTMFGSRGNWIDLLYLHILLWFSTV